MIAPARVLVTGASGFVGAAVLRSLASSSAYQAVGVSRAPRSGSSLLLSPELAGGVDWSGLVRGCDVVVHCAARVHVMHGQGTAALDLYRHTNVEGTCALASQAAVAGVTRFVFISSVKVHGESTSAGRPFRAGDEPQPLDAYSISKLEAERRLAEIARDSGMEVVIIRPPLVYGPGVKANFLRMMRWVERGIPLPFGALDNRRSIVALDNLVSLIKLCIEHPSAANQTFLVSDQMDLSTTDLLRRMAHALGVPSRLLSVPGSIIEAVARVGGRAELAQRLCGSLQVDCSETCNVLGWSPSIGVDEGLARTADWFRGVRG